MQPRQLDRFKERLLKAGVAYRHAHRFVQELRDHYDDAVRDELAKGLNRATAEQTAWTRIGDEERLASSVLARAELRSVACRCPGLVFGVAPLLIWLGALILMGAFLVAFDEFADGTQASPFKIAYAMCFFSTRLLPVGLGIAALTICARQRLKSSWSIIGIGTVAAISGTFSTSMTLPTAGHMGQLGVGSSLLPFLLPHVAAVGRPDGAVLAAGLIRGSCMLAMSLVPYLLWNGHQRALRTET